MEKKQDLHDLNLTELQLLLEHLRLGPDHLKLILSQEQFRSLLSWCHLSQKEAEFISADKAEKAGNVALIINTMVTSIFGAWMGLSGCMGCQLGSLKTLSFVTGIALLASGSIGYASFNFTKNQAKQAIYNQRLHYLQLYLTKLINQKLDKKIEQETHYLNTAVFLLEEDKEYKDQERYQSCTFDTAPEAFEWLEHLKRLLKKRVDHFNHTSIYTLYKSELIKIINRLNKILTKHISFVSNLANQSHPSRPTTNIAQLPFLQVLTNPAFTIPKSRLANPASWIKNNLASLLLGLTPTIFGGFASMFVFVGGIPNVSKALGFSAFANLLTQPLSRTVELMLAGCITAYFGFSYIHSTRKTLYRKILLDQTYKKISNEDVLSLEKNHKLQVLLKIKTQIQKIISILNVLKKLDKKLIKSSFIKIQNRSGVKESV